MRPFVAKYDREKNRRRYFNSGKDNAGKRKLRLRALDGSLEELVANFRVLGRRTRIDALRRKKVF